MVASRMLSIKVTSIGVVIAWAAFCCLRLDHTAAGPIDGSEHFSESDDSALRGALYGVSPHKNGTNCVCGLPKMFAPRIVGGERRSIMQYPWMAGLSAYGFIFCGGAIINDRYILSAAHCFKADEVRHITVASLGITYRNEQEKMLPYEVEQVILHEKYNKTVKGRYDIALVKLTRPLEFTNKIRPVCLPLSTTNFTDLYGTVTGWGVLEHGGQMSNELRGVPMRIMDYDTCHRLYNYANHNSLCAGGVEGQDACQGDSGSPLFVDVDDAYRLAGVVSWGIGCAKKGYPGVFTNIQHYLPWIINNTRDAECQQDAMNPGWTEAVKAVPLNNLAVDDDDVEVKPTQSTVKPTETPHVEAAGSAGNATMMILTTTPLTGNATQSITDLKVNENLISPGGTNVTTNAPTESKASLAAATISNLKATSIVADVGKTGAVV